MRKPLLSVLVLLSTMSLVRAGPLELRLREQKSWEEKTKVEGAEPKSGESTQEIRLVLEPSAFSERRGDLETVFDLAKGRKFTIDHKKRVYRESPLLAAVASRHFEAANQVQISRVMKAGQIEAVKISRFSIESRFGMDAGRGAGDLGRVEFVQEGTHWRGLHEDKEVAKGEDSATELPEALQETFLLYLRYRHALHPRFLAKLSRKRLPKVLNYSVDHLTRVIEGTYTLLGTAAPQSKIGLPEGYARGHDPEDPLDRVLKALRSKTPPRQSPEEATVFIEAALSKGAVLDSFLGLMELTLQDKVDVGPLIQKLRGALSQDPATREFLQGMQLSGDPKRAAEGIKQLDAISRKGLQKGYMIDVFRAVGFKVTRRHKEAAAAYLSVLAKNPWATGPYKDLGDVYLASFRAERAWRCWEAAMRISPDHGLLGGVSELETRLMNDYPEFFMSRAK